MDFKGHYRLMAVYNRRMNQQVFQAAALLSAEQLNQDVGTYFSSVLGTLNHILVGDLLWLARFSDHSDQYVTLDKLKQFPFPTALNQLLYDDLSSLFETRKAVDEIIEQWLESDTEYSHFQQDLTYQNSRGVVSVRNFAELVAHLFNHQTHHRGQASALLFQLGVDVGVTDFLMDIPDKYE